ncbi:response regulator [Dyella sp.]|uniref:response regulator n=1 Tax=Dyella sp. TaxID=1869338 RepID=UPI002ED07186
MASDTKKETWLADQPIQRKILLAIGLLLGLFLLASLFTLSALQKQNDNRRWATHTYSVLLELADVRVAMQTAQLGARGYILNQREDELANFRSGLTETATHLEAVRKLTSDNSLQQARLDRMQDLVTKWRDEVTTIAIDPVRGVTTTDTEQKLHDLQRIRTDYVARRTVRIEDAYALLDQMAHTEDMLLTVRNDALASTLNATRIVNIVFALLGLAFGIMVISLTFRLITRPLRRITDLMTRLSNRDHGIEVRQLTRRDEIGEIARALQVFKSMVIETQGQTWLKTQASEIAGRLLRTTTHRDFAHELTSSLVPLLGAGLGIYYLYDNQREQLDLLGSYGLRQVWQGPETYMPGEGLVGQCLNERRIVELQDVPANYLRIHSGSGEAVPSHIVIMPVLVRGEFCGVLELASFSALQPLQRQLLDELLPIVGLTQENLTRAIRTQALLEQTREQADELRTSELVMRQQKEVLRDSHDALQAKTAELEEQSQRLVASEEELRVQTEELQASNEELREKTETLNEQKRVLERLQRETLEKADELERASQYKSEFLANMSHELRTPLNSLLILSRSLAENREQNLDEEQIESARIIHDSGSNLLRLINDILDLSKIEAGKMELNLAESPLSSLVRSLKRTFDHVAQEKNVGLQLELDPSLPQVVMTDLPKLEQVLTNLVGNAFKFTAQGTVSIRIGRPAADIALPEKLAGKPVIAIAVADTGIGIPADKFQKIFSAFEQVDSSTSRQYGGTGLGLAISLRIVELLGGSIDLRSREGHGSTFTLLLPELPASGTDVSMDKESSHTETSYSRAPTTAALLPESIDDDRETLNPEDKVILIVEDDPIFARILADMVHRKGYRVLAAAEGESALKLALKFKPAGILLDVMLPGMDGWSVIERLKGNDDTRHIPVHFISAVDEAHRGRELGAVGFLTKPVSREAINGAFERLMHFAEGGTRHLLIVDDDNDSRAAVRTLLNNDGVTIDEAASAEQALERIASTEYDCVVLDLSLPGMSGMDLLEQLSMRGQIPPVVIYSGRDLSREENLKLRRFTDSIVVKGARAPERLLDEVSLFLHSVRTERRHVAAASQRTAVDDELRGRKVLLVDDDMRNLFALSKVMREWGLVVTMAQDGQKALKSLADNNDIELVLTDIMMPVMDGYETIKAIRMQPQYANLPIIALTAKAMRGDREKCLEVGANDYLSKPIDIDKLSSMMRVWLHR